MRCPPRRYYPACICRRRLAVERSGAFAHLPTFAQKGVRRDKMRYELVEDREESRKRGESVLDFRVHAEPGETFTPSTRALADAAAFSAALAWEAVNVWKWPGPVQ